uniref:EGF-like domain-containing protein n=1 Tax=Erpetoichthys calabaricus TaxID=27687 RepID=A0A8C4XFM1_ERPCA
MHTFNCTCVNMYAYPVLKDSQKLTSFTFVPAFDSCSLAIPMKTMNNCENQRNSETSANRSLSVYAYLLFIFQDGITGHIVCRRQSVSEWHSSPQRISMNWTENTCLEDFTECWANQSEWAHPEFSSKVTIPQICPLQVQLGDQIFISNPESHQTLQTTIVKVPLDEFLSCSKTTYSNSDLTFENSVQGWHKFDTNQVGPGTYYFIGMQAEDSGLCQSGLRLNVTVRDQHCRDPPQTTLCSANGICRAHIWQKDYKCLCNEHYFGKFCENVDVCWKKPCLNGAINNFFDLFAWFVQCHCPPGWTGELCQHVENSCLIFPDRCKNGATCIDISLTKECSCLRGFTGQFCETDIDYCIGHECSKHSICVDQPSNYTCHCMLGYGGTFCETDINECGSSPCKNGATCKDLVGNFSCQCSSGFKGIYCEINVNECRSHPCLHNAMCVDLINGYECVCLPGVQCETDMDECASHSCENGATCLEETELEVFPFGFRCQCATGFIGLYCEINVNECSSNPCINGYCYDGNQKQFTHSRKEKHAIYKAASLAQLLRLLSDSLFGNL